MTGQRPRQRINLTVDADVWQRCNEVSKLVPGGVNFSRVAEMAFVNYLENVEVIRAQLARLDQTRGTTSNAALMVFAAMIEGNTETARHLLDEFEESRTQ